MVVAHWCDVGVLRGVGNMLLVLAWPLIPWIFIVVSLTYWAASALYLGSMGTKQFTSSNITVEVSYKQTWTRPNRSNLFGRGGHPMTKGQVWWAHDWLNPGLIVFSQSYAFHSQRFVIGWPSLLNKSLPLGIAPTWIAVSLTWVRVIIKCLLWIKCLLIWWTCGTINYC